jgi:hypothetical protein
MPKVRIEDLEELEDLPTQERIIRTPKEERHGRVDSTRVKKRHTDYEAARKLKEYKEHET